MHEYYFKIKKGDIEFEFSTSDKFTFEEKLSDWINGVVQGQYVAPPIAEIQKEKEQTQEEGNTERSGFIDVKNLTSINQMTTPEFDFGEKQENEIATDFNFEQALEDSMINPKTTVVEKQDDTDNFSNYIQTYTPQSQTDFLIVTASYLLNIEHLELFSIKQLNAKLIPYIGPNGAPITHADIQAAIDEGLLRVVPDLTGTSEVTEYTLTDLGYGYFVE